MTELTAEERLELLSILNAAMSCLPKLDATIHHSEHFTTVYSIRSRVKNAARLAEKVREKRESGRPNYWLHDVSDLIGIRFISLYRQDVTSAIMHALALITGDTDVSPNAFRDATLLEFISYTSNSIAEEDAVNTELKAFYEHIEEKTGVKLVLLPRSRYSSVHLVLKLPVKHNGENYSVAVELQFRSVFEDAWAEIDHKLLYELRRFGRRPDEDRREAIAAHMTILKKMVDTAADYADVIRRTVIDPSERPTNIRRNLDDGDYITNLAERAGIDEALRTGLVDLLAEKVKIDALIEKGSPGVSKEQYLKVAEKLISLQPQIEATPARGGKDALQAIEFSVRMEVAICRMLSEQEGQLKLAVDAYLQVCNDFPAFPGGWFRAGQALQRQSELTDVNSEEAVNLAEMAFEHFGKAIEALDASNGLPRQKRIVVISPDQEKYISNNARRLQCFAKWRIVDRRKEAGLTLGEEDLAKLIIAFALNQGTFVGESDKQRRVTGANNSAYYASDAITLAEKLTLRPPGLPETNDLVPLLKILEEDGKDLSNVMMLNTMVYAYLVTDQAGKAVEAAKKILDLNADDVTLDRRKAMSAYTLEASERSTKDAWKVVRQYS